MNKTLAALALGLLVLVSSLWAQQVINGNRYFVPGTGIAIQVPNATSTGTTLNKVAKLTGAPSTAVIAATTDTGGAIGIVIDGAGTTGNAVVARSGEASCVFDGATTAGDYVKISATVAGDCFDAGASYPLTGQVLGRVLSTNGGGGTYAMTVVGTEIQAQAPATGSYWTFGSAVGASDVGGTNPFAVLANDIYLYAVYVPLNVTGFTKIWIAVSAADTGGNTYDIGLYGPWTSAGTCTLVADIGATSLATTTGYREFSVSSSNLTGGNWYVFATTANGVAATKASLKYSSGANNLSVPFAGATQITGGGSTLPGTITCPTAAWAGSTGVIFGGVR